MFDERPWDREEEQASEDYHEGHITKEQYNQLIREILRDCREAAQEAAQEAYDREIGEW